VCRIVKDGGVLEATKISLHSKMLMEGVRGATFSNKRLNFLTKAGGAAVEGIEVLRG